MRTVIISSPLATQSGYGYHAREFIKNIIDIKSAEWDIKLLSMPWGHTPFTYELPDSWKQRIIPLPLQKQPDIWVQITVPNEFQPVGKYNIGVTAGTEGDICPADWIDRINSFNLIVVPSEFTKTVFENSAKHHNKVITTTIQVVPEYYDETVFNNTNIVSINGLDEIPESFAFLSVGHWLSGQLGEDRKNISGMIHSFYECYRDDKTAPALVLKTSGATYSVTDRFEIESKIREVQELHRGHKLPSVYLLHGELSDTEMNSLYNHPKIKALVSFTKAEGFGRPLLEFCTTAKPIIAPYYSGQTEFLKSDFICKVPGGLTPIHPSAQNQFLIAEAKWFSPNYTEAKHIWKDVKNNYKKYQELAKRQRYYASINFTSAAVEKHYHELFRLVETQTKDIPQQIELKLPKLQPVK
jgi:hypothetical protein